MTRLRVVVAVCFAVSAMALLTAVSAIWQVMDLTVAHNKLAVAHGELVAQISKERTSPGAASVPASQATVALADAVSGPKTGSNRRDTSTPDEDALEPTDWRLSDEAPIIAAQLRDQIRMADEKIREAEIFTAQSVAKARQHKAKLKKELLDLRREDPVDDLDKQRVASFEVLTKQQLREAEEVSDLEVGDARLRTDRDAPERQGVE